MNTHTHNPLFVNITTPVHYNIYCIIIHFNDPLLDWNCIYARWIFCRNTLEHLHEISWTCRYRFCECLQAYTFAPYFISKSLGLLTHCYHYAHIKYCSGTQWCTFKEKKIKEIWKTVLIWKTMLRGGCGRQNIWLCEKKCK